jgi:hypothetical protein
MQHAYTLTEKGKVDEVLAEIGRAIKARPAEKELFYHRAYARPSGEKDGGARRLARP